MQWPAATLMTGLTCAYWTYAIVGGQLFAITGNIFLFWLISKISRADDRREREAFLLNGVGGVVLNRYILAPRPLYRSARTVVTAAKDLWTGRNVALKMTEVNASFELVQLHSAALAFSFAVFRFRIAHLAPSSHSSTSAPCLDQSRLTLCTCSASTI